MAYFFSGSLNGAEGTLGTDSDGDERLNLYPCGTGFIVPFEVVLHGWNGPQIEQTRVIDNRADWCAFRPSACTTPLIDFSTHVAIVVADGSKPDGCHDIRVTGIHTGATSTDLVVEYESMRFVPTPPCGCTFAFVEPFEVVKTPRPVTSATFTKIPRTITLPCH